MSARQLRVSPELALPLDVAGEAIGILAKRGAGKTNTATVLVEELHRAGVQTVILDPVGAWWGLRSSADGESEGLSIPVLGGQHGDVALEQTAGSLIADVVVDSGQSLLIDLSDFPSKGAVSRFVTDFAERLYRRKGKSPSLLHLVLEEADEFAPQAQRADTARMRGAIEQIVRRGRSRGLGITLVTQRSAVLNKDVLTQVDVLIVMRTTGPHDAKAIKEWVASHPFDGADDVLPSLSHLETGEAWIWNPERDVLRRVKIRRRRTFDSSATPKAGEHKVEPNAIAAINLEKLGTEIQRTAEKAKADDPRELRRQIGELESRVRRAEQTTELLEKATAEREPVLTIEQVEVPVVGPDQVAALERAIEELVRSETAFLSDLAQRADAIRDAVGEITFQLRRIARTDHTSPRGENHRQQLERTRSRAARVPDAVSPPRRPQAASRPVHPDVDDVQLKAGARRILATLARHHPLRVTRAQLGTLAKFKITGGTFQTYFSQLRRLELLEVSGGEISLTQAGLDYIGHVPASPQTTEELLDMWRGSLKAGARTMLDVLVDHYPEALGRDYLAELVGMTPTGGTFQTYLSTLRRNGLVDADSDGVRASDTLFVAGTAAR